MKQPVTFRLDAELLLAARVCARRENRSLTNFVETILKHHIANAHGSSETSVTAVQKAALQTGGRPDD